MKVAVTSSAVEQIASKNIAATQGWPFYSFNDFKGLTECGADVLLFLGWFVPDLKDWWQHKFRIGKDQRVVVLWAGSDILHVKQMKQNGAVQMFKDFESDQYCHVPESDFQKDELLKLFNLKSTEPLASPAREIFQDIGLPEKFTAGVYSPTQRYPFYRLPQIGQALADAQVKGIFYHFLFDYAKLDVPCFNDKRYAITWDEYKQTVADSSCGIRVPEHDGLSLGAAEFLMAGRPMITCWDMPRWPRVIKGEVTIEKIAKAVKKVAAGDYYVPASVRAFYRDYFDPAKYKERLQERLREKWDGFTFGD